MMLTRIFACLVVFLHTAVDAEVTPWKIGGSGLDWATSDSVAILVDKASGAIQPVYIRPDRPIFSYLEDWGDWNPRELGYIDGERPRVAGGLRLVDGDSTSYLKARTALTVYQAQERQLSIQKKKGVLVDRARAETLVFRLARQERDVWVTWPTRVAALMAAQLSAEMEKASGTPATIETAILQRVLETHVREQLDALADLRVSLA